jgi:thiamine-phosphate pyrophosphorylase
LPFPRFYPILDTDLLTLRGMSPLDAARAMIDGGARILQLRHKGQYTREMFESAEAIAQMCRESDVSFIVNDRADIARLLDAGLHIGQDDLTPSDARQIIGTARTLGFSTHNEDQFQRALAEPVDYLAFGPVFSTSSKQNPDPVAGLDALSRMPGLTNRPLVAIGGITRTRAAEVFAHGADSLAVIADVYPDPLDGVSLRQRVREWIAVTKKCYL